MTARLDELSERLEQAAVALRAGELAPEAAAELVEECARLAGDATAELERAARGEPVPGQTELEV